MQLDRLAVIFYDMEVRHIFGIAKKSAILLKVQTVASQTLSFSNIERAALFTLFPKN